MAGSGQNFTISIFFFVILTTTQMNFIAHGSRPMGKWTGNSKIGSRPPRCDRRRCDSCGHCEAIQVPTNPQIKKNGFKINSTNVSSIAYPSRGGDDDYSNYKPMSWKCKCGDHIYNP